MVFNFSEEEVNLILACVAKQPFEVVFKLVNSISEQSKNQPQPAKVEVVSDESKE